VPAIRSPAIHLALQGQSKAPHEIIDWPKRTSRNELDITRIGGKITKALKTAFCIAVVLIGLAIVIGASAQMAATNNPPFQQSSNAPALPAPASNRLVLSTVAGKVRVFDSKGLLLESNLDYLPRINISDLSDSDLHALLETKTAYAALTTFGHINERNAQSAIIENQLRQVWLHGKSLAEKIQTRLDLLEDMRAYNLNVACLPGLVTGASDAAAHAGAMNDRLTDKNQEAATAANNLENTEDARAAGDASHDQVHDARSEAEDANERAAKANNRAIAAQYQSAVANQSLQNYLNACTVISDKLAAYGINVPATPPFYLIPPLSMRSEVDAERMAGVSSTVSPPTGR
jgi:hypothetical protein